MEPILFYEHEYYPFSSFSSFRLLWKNIDFDTSEHTYHWEKFPEFPEIQEEIRTARSAHDALKLSRKYKEKQRQDWDEVKVGIMKEILNAKVSQHPYVRKKLMDSGDREIIEDSWRDDFWGWGPNKDGKNQLGKLWMEVRQELKASLFTTFVFLATDYQHLTCWLSDHQLLGGVGLVLHDKAADIVEGQSGVFRIIVLTERDDKGKQKVWTVYKDYSPSFDLKKNISNLHTLYKEIWREDKTKGTREDPPLSPNVQDLRTIQYEFYPFLD